MGRTSSLSSDASMARSRCRVAGIRRWTVGVLLFTAVFSAVAEMLPVTTLTVRQVVTVSNQPLRLGDVADIGSSHLPTLQYLMALPLWRIRADRTSLIDRDSLETWVARQSPQDIGRVIWRGASASEFSPPLFEVSGEDIIRAAESALRSHLQLIRPTRAAAEISSRPVRSISVSTRNVSLSARPIRTTSTSSRVLVWIDVFAEEQFVRAIPVSLELAAEYVAVDEPVAARALKQPMNPRPAVIDETRSGVLPQASTRHFVKEVGVSGTADSAVTARYGVPKIKPTNPVVARGDPVLVVAREGFVTLEMRGTATQDGLVGQRISVHLDGQSRSVTALVAASGRVEIGP